jgi:hypothetical protein
MNADDIRNQFRAEVGGEIDTDDLVNEWKRQAGLMFEWGFRLAQATNEVDEKKLDLSRVDGELDRAIRSDPAAYGLTKATETTVPAAVAEQVEHEDAVRAVNDARYRQNAYKAAVDALEHRKRALTCLTDLTRAEWYSDPRSTAQPDELREAAAGPRKPRGRTVRRAVADEDRDED